jgi:hypothetical protein
MAKKGVAKRRTPKVKSPVVSKPRRRGEPSVSSRRKGSRRRGAELERRLELARAAAATKATERRREAQQQPPPRKWFGALERMQVHLSSEIGRQCALRASGPGQPSLRGTPWSLIARFSGFDGQMTYDRLWRGIAATEADTTIESTIGAKRLARMVVLYKGPTERGGERLVEREFVLSEIAPWSVMLARALERLDPDIEDSITAHYGEDAHVPTEVRALYVWISVDQARAR